MSLDVSLTLPSVAAQCVFSANVTHNLGPMAREVGIYSRLWHPKHEGVTRAWQLIDPLRNAIAKLEANPKVYRALDAQNGWGTYDEFLPWLKELLVACERHPGAMVEANP